LFCELNCTYSLGNQNLKYIGHAETIARSHVRSVSLFPQAQVKETFTASACPAFYIFCKFLVVTLESLVQKMFQNPSSLTKNA